MPHGPPAAPPDAVTLPSVLLVEHDPVEAAFVHSLFVNILKADVWLCHETALEGALKLLSVVRFRLILLDLDLPKVSSRKAIRAVRAAAAETPLVLRLRAEDFRPELDPRLYGADALAPKGVGAPLLRAVRRLLWADEGRASETLWG